MKKTISDNNSKIQPKIDKKRKKIDLEAIDKFLEYHDFFDDLYFVRVEALYPELIGQLLIEFTYLEHMVNYVTAEFIDKDNFKTGYIILENLNIDKKVDLFYKFYLTLISPADEKMRTELVEIRKELIRVKTFRNAIVHADWQTMDEKHFVRTKIVVKGDDGLVNFVNYKITPDLIKINVRRIGELKERIMDFTFLANKI